MKRHLLTLAIAASLLPLAAQASPRVYGSLNLSVDYMDASVMNPSEDMWALNSNASRIGVKGAEKLNEEYTAVYKLEWEVTGDAAGNAAAPDLSSRERYIGIKHYQWGTMRLGFMDAPLKNAEDEIDIFNDLVSLDMGNFITGQNRLANSINYVSPKFLDVFGANITMQPGEQVNSVNENHLADGYSAAFSYEDDSLYLSYAMDKDISSNLQKVFVDTAVSVGALPLGTTSYSEARDAMRFNVRYKISDLTLSAMLQKSEASNNANTVAQKLDEQAVVLSGSYKMDSFVFRGQVSMINLDAGKNINTSSDEIDTTLIGVGVDYNLTENTKVFGNLANVKNELSLGGASTDMDTTYLGVGTEVRF